MKEEIIRLEKIAKKTNEVVLLDDFNLNIFKGEILGIFSLNTVGKDALISILCSESEFDFGRIYFNDILMDSKGFTKNYTNKVRVIDSKVKLLPNLTVGENIFVMRKGFEKYFISKKTLYQQSAIFFKSLGIVIDPNKIAIELTSFEVCAVELVKAYATNAKLIILCDLSNYLNAVDLDKFNNLVLSLLKKRISFLYADNDVDILFKMSNRIVVMGDGKNLRTLRKEQFKEENVMNILMGEEFGIKNRQKQKTGDEAVLELKNVLYGNLNNINFKIFKGEIISLLDVSGKHYGDVIDVLTESRLESGEIIFLNKPYYAAGKKKAISCGIGFITEDLPKKILFEDLSVLENLLFMMPHKSGGLWLKRKIRKSVFQEYYPKIGDDIYASNLDNISAETENKIIYYRWRLYSPNLLICVKPFGGQDVSMRELTVSLINEISLKGVSVIILSSNITESYILGNRILLLDRGVIIKEYEKNKTSIREINSDIDGIKVR